MSKPAMYIAGAFAGAMYLFHMPYFIRVGAHYWNKYAFCPVIDQRNAGAGLPPRGVQEDTPRKN